MNDKIYEIAEQADKYANSLYSIHGESLKGHYQDAMMEKFSELLVKKFDDILLLEHLDCVGNKDKKAEERIHRLREKVKTYFGVKE